MEYALIYLMVGLAIAFVSDLSNHFRGQGEDAHYVRIIVAWPVLLLALVLIGIGALVERVNRP